MNRLLLLFSFMVFGIGGLQAQHTISGTVKGSNGEALIGVNIVEKGTTNGVATDIDGKYQLKLSSAEVTVVFSYIGYQTQEIEVKGQATIDVVLLEGTELNEVQIVGSRSYNRSLTESPVAVDVIDIADQAALTGQAEVSQLLQYAAPSFNATRQSGSDGADHIVPASLRGLGPDQTLVLVNGKRRHQSSLVNIFGTRGRGNSGTDMNAIPAAAIKRIEVLRDGASAQYGSDAIAGVINIVLKDQTEGLTGGVTYGAYSTAVGEGWEDEAGDVLYNVEGENRLDGEERSFDGNTFRLDLNYGVALGDKGGYANVTTEYMNRERTLRPGWSWRKGYGSAAAETFNFMANVSYPISENTEVYAFGGRNFRDTDAYAFSRSSFDDGDNRAVPSLYPNGFTPRITSNIIDASASVGVRHEMENGWKADFNHSYGSNMFHYFIKGSNNASMGASSPTDFDAGGHSLAQHVTSLDFSKYYKDIASGFNLAYGMEYRSENFTIFAGEEASYATYDTNGEPIINPALQEVAIDSNGDALPGGSQGFPGYSPDNEVDRSRTNFGLYLDAEISPTDDFLVAGAVRYENYSDFGSTLNYKLASRYTVSENLSLRGSVSSGFRAPSLVQIYYNLIFNNIVNGRSVPSLLSANNSTVTKAFGIEQLKEETAVNASIGFALTLGDFSATVDAYSIAVNDRIILTDNFDASGLGIGVDAAQFFANGVDTRTSGVDIVLGYEKEVGKGTLDASIAANFNDLRIDRINNGNLNEYTFFSPFSRAYLEAAAPDYKLVFNLGYKLEKVNFNLALTQFSRVELQDFQWVDTPATTAAEAEALREVATDVYDAAMIVDFSITYNMSKALNFTIGGNNLLNKYPTPQFDGWTDQGGFSDSVQMGSDGAYIFGRVGFRF